MRKRWRPEREINPWDIFKGLTIIEELDRLIDKKSWKYKRRFKCQCKCWNITEIWMWAIWITISCGCIQRNKSKPRKNDNREKNYKLLIELRNEVIRFFNSWFLSKNRIEAKEKIDYYLSILKLQDNQNNNDWFTSK